MLNTMLGAVAQITLVELSYIILSTQIISMYSHHRAYLLAFFSSKKLNILDIFVTKIPSNLHCLTNNILDLNSDHSSIIFIVSATAFARSEQPRLFSL